MRTAAVGSAVRIAHEKHGFEYVAQISGEVRLQLIGYSRNAHKQPMQQVCVRSKPETNVGIKTRTKNKSISRSTPPPPIYQEYLLILYGKYNHSKLHCSKCSRYTGKLNQLKTFDKQYPFSTFNSHAEHSKSVR